MAESEVVADGGGDGRGTNPGPIRASTGAPLSARFDNVEQFLRYAIVINSDLIYLLLKFFVAICGF